MNSKNELCQFACQIGLNLIKGKKTLEDLKKIVTRNLKDIDSAYSGQKLIFLKLQHSQSLKQCIYQKTILFLALTVASANL